MSYRNLEALISHTEPKALEVTTIKFIGCNMHQQLLYYIYSLLCYIQKENKTERNGQKYKYSMNSYLAWHTIYACQARKGCTFINRYKHTSEHSL